MKQVKTAKGRVIDMAALAKTNETTRAVSPGNEKMTGRGDRIDSSGNVLQTVKAKARAQHDTTSAPEMRNLSDVPTAPAKKTRDKKADVLSEVAEDEVPNVVRREEKTRGDGTQYVEVEYDDGSMEVEEI
jgi:hypothetical protein